MKFKVSQNRTGSAAVCLSGERKVNCAGHDRGNGNDRQIDTRDDAVGGTSSARPLFLRGASVSPSPRERIFSKRPAGRDRVSRVHRGVPTFSRSAPIVARPFFVDPRARRCPSSASFRTGESRYDRRRNHRPRRRPTRRVRPPRDRSPAANLPLSLSATSSPFSALLNSFLLSRT